MSRIRKGTIIGMYRERGCGMALLAIEDDLRGKILAPCDGNATARALDTAFPGALIGGISINNDAIVGEPIFYRLDQIGVLAEFSPADETPTDVIEEYESGKKKPSAHKAGCTHRGFAPPGDPIYGGRLIVAGREISNRSKETIH
jgi:hypothetical protein